MFYLWRKKVKRDSEKHKSRHRGLFFICLFTSQFTPTDAARPKPGTRPPYGGQGPSPWCIICYFSRCALARMQNWMWRWGANAGTPMCYRSPNARATLLCQTPIPYFRYFKDFLHWFKIVCHVSYYYFVCVYPSHWISQKVECIWVTLILDNFLLLCL